MIVFIGGCYSHFRYSDNEIAYVYWKGRFINYKDIGEVATPFYEIARKMY
jgi:hypothetical protein